MNKKVIIVLICCVLVICCILTIVLLKGNNKQSDTSLPSSPSIPDSEYGKANDKVEELIKKMKEYNQTITVIEYNNWDEENNRFNLEQYYEIDLNNKVGYIHEIAIRNGNRDEVNTTKYVDFENKIEYSIFKGWSDWEKETSDPLEEYLQIDYLERYDYAKKGKVLYGRYEEHGDKFLIEIHLNNEGLIDYYTTGAAYDEWNLKNGSTPYKTSYSYSNKSISIPQEAIDKAK